MPDEDKIYDHFGTEVIFTAGRKGNILFIAANDSCLEKRVFIFRISELPKIQAALAKITEELDSSKPTPLADK